MIIIAQDLHDLTDSVVYLTTNCNASAYPTDFQTYNEAWDSLRQSLDHLRDKLGEGRHMQLVEMAAQAKTHYDEGYAITSPGDRSAPGSAGSEHIRLGSWLLQDIERLVKGKPAFAYPEELYRWPR